MAIEMLEPVFMARYLYAEQPNSNKSEAFFDTMLFDMRYFLKSFMRILLIH